MKDATGELSMTAVAVVAIAAISVLFGTLIWPTIQTQIRRSTYCSTAFDCDCELATADNMCRCWYCADDGKDGGEGADFASTCETPKQIDCPKDSN